MRPRVRRLAGLAATALLVAGLAATALLVAGLGSASGTAGTLPPPCSPRALSATFALVPFSQGAGHVLYALTITDHRGRCRITPPRITLLGARDRPLPSRAGGLGAGQVLLSPGGYAQASGRFSPDVNGPGEPGTPCEPTMRALRLSLGAGAVRAPADPTPVCERGAIAFTRLRAVPPSAACRASAFRLAVSRRQSAGDTLFALTLRHAGAHACHTSGPPVVRFLSAADARIPIHPVTGVPFPYRFAPAGRGHSLAEVARTRPGASNCIAATGISVGLGAGHGTIVKPLVPATMICGPRRVTVSGLYA